MKEFALGAIFAFLITFFIMWFTMEPKATQEPSFIYSNEIPIAKVIMFGPNGELTSLIFDEENWNKLLHNLEEWGIKYEYMIKDVPY